MDMTMIEHPYIDLTGGKWLKGNLHTHTTVSDGQRTHQEVIDEYASRGYDFLMISDHDVYTSTEELEAFDNQGLILLPGNEISVGGPHMLHVGATEFVEPDTDRQNVIDNVLKGRGFVIFNHPNWQMGFNHCPQGVLERHSGYMGLEIYNGVISRLEGSPYATNRWDLLLGSGRKVWGFGNDDTHRVNGDTELGWNVVYVKGNDPWDVVDALRKGRFYVSTGVAINRIKVEGMRIELETENASRIVALGDFGKRFEQIDGKSISVEVPTGTSYVRFECWGTGESFAWTQPFYVV
jgi:hypothetical protein